MKLFSTFSICLSFELIKIYFLRFFNRQCHGQISFKKHFVLLFGQANLSKRSVKIWVLFSFNFMAMVHRWLSKRVRGQIQSESWLHKIFDAKLALHHAKRPLSFRFQKEVCFYFLYCLRILSKILTSFESF